MDVREAKKNKKVPFSGDKKTEDGATKAKHMCT